MLADHFWRQHVILGEAEDFRGVLLIDMLNWQTNYLQISVINRT